MSTTATKAGTQTYEGAFHGLADTPKDRLNADLPACLGIQGCVAGAAPSLSSVSVISNALRRRKM